MSARCRVALVLSAASPAFAQVSFVGDWSGRYHEDQPDRVPGEEPGDFSGLPINEAARMFGDSWDVARHSVLEHQCAPYTLPYMFFGPNQFRIWEEKQPRHAGAHRDPDVPGHVSSSGAPSGWTAARIRPSTRRTRSWGSRPASGTATS